MANGDNVARLVYRSAFVHRRSFTCGLAALPLSFQSGVVLPQTPDSLVGLGLVPNGQSCCYQCNGNTWHANLTDSLDPAWKNYAFRNSSVETVAGLQDVWGLALASRLASDGAPSS